LPAIHLVSRNTNNFDTRILYQQINENKKNDKDLDIAMTSEFSPSQYAS